MQRATAQNLCEELGDVLFQVALHSVIAEEEGLFTIKDVISGVESKMKFRHPKIFSPDDAEAVSLSWDELKAREKTEEIRVIFSLKKRQEAASNGRKSLDNLTQKVYI